MVYHFFLHVDISAVIQTFLSCRNAVSVMSLNPGDREGASGARQCKDKSGTKCRDRFPMPRQCVSSLPRAQERRWMLPQYGGKPWPVSDSRKP